MDPSPDITPVEHRVALCDRERRNAHQGGVLWLTGLSGAGKTTLAFALEERLFRDGLQVYVLDGDNVRHGLNADLGFSRADRGENIRRAGEVAALFADAGVLCIAAFISPYREDRAAARAAAPGRFHEVYVRADLATCERRDPKGLYRRARAGEIANFTAVDDIYEPPEDPSLTVDTTENDIECCIAMLVDYVRTRFQPEGGPGVSRAPARRSQS
ncbi:MAG: adenylyl-sulfate kinase [Gammaproteobacteria bacterium]|nr:adenylyl-sulfate kinase [Gammaproteobacteria bacterium]